MSLPLAPIRGQAKKLGAAKQLTSFEVGNLKYSAYL